MLPRVQEFFQDRSVFITGASGFLGKVLVEKLLYSLPEVRHIFIVVRSARGVAPAERWKKITDGVLYNRVRRDRPDALQKVVVIEGDMLEENFGMNQHDVQRICDEVSIVFHCAATVKFDERLSDAVQMNVRGTTRMISLCHRMSKLACLVHCSTAYANCDRVDTEERVYPPPFNPQKLNESMEWMTPEMIEALTPTLLGKRPNTYTLTKALAEAQLLEDAKGLPVIIFRPSIVTAMWKEQLPGWIDNVNGPTGLFTAVGKGVLSNMFGKIDGVADVIPVDIVSNMMIACAAYRMHQTSDDIPVMHCTSGKLNPLKWRLILSLLEQIYREHPMDQTFGVVSAQFNTSRILFELNHRFKHEAPGKMFDLACRAVGKSPPYERVYRRVRIMVDTLEYFTTREWNFDSKNLPMLWDQMHPEDKKIFNFDIRQVEWTSYIFDYMMGVKKYVLKENVEDTSKIAAAKQQYKIVVRVRFITHVVLCYFLAKILARIRHNGRLWTWFTLAFAATTAMKRLKYRQIHRIKSLEQYLSEQK